MQGTTATIEGNSTPYSYAYSGAIMRSCPASFTYQLIGNDEYLTLSLEIVAVDWNPLAGV